ncbi:hypothetical protein ACFRK5_21830 [Streptomyces niveus]|uniref:hypothetical protein n=1 Tax=Streptomyces niveus TaxID=193462 RepID=UPI0036C9F154
MTINQQTDLRKVFYQCRLGKDDIEHMFSMAREGIAAPEIEVSTVAGHTRYWGESLSAVVANVQASAPEVGENWSNLSLIAKTDAGERAVSISLEKERTVVDIAGTDATWVFGQGARLEKYLTSRGGVASSPSYENRISLLFLAFFVGLGIFWFTRKDGVETVEECVRKTKEAADNQPYVNALFAFFLLAAILFCLYQALKRRASRAQLMVESNVNSGTWWARLSTAEKLAAIGVPIAALASLGALASAASDITGK